MGYRTLLVHLELNADNADILQVTAELAGRFGSRVIGIAAAQPIQPLLDEGLAMPDLATQDRAELERELTACRDQFEKALAKRVRQTEWRAAITFGGLADYIADQARCADLVITGRDIGASVLDNSRRVNVSDLVFRAGRPVLIVPPGISSLPLRHVFLGWKDSREARRAALDGLPLLKAAGRATVVEVTSQHDKAAADARVTDVAAWLGQHQVEVTPLGVATQSGPGGHLHALLLDRRCDLLIAGAYGHNRLGEWMLGGVTQDMLLDPDFCVLLTH